MLDRVLMHARSPDVSTEFYTWLPVSIPEGVSQENIQHLISI